MIIDASPALRATRKRGLSARGRVLAVAGVTCVAGFGGLTGKVYGGEVPRSANYVVHDGDTLWSIAADHGIGGGDVRKAVQEIIDANRLNGAEIFSGERLVVPSR